MATATLNELQALWSALNAELDERIQDVSEERDMDHADSIAHWVTSGGHYSDFVYQHLPIDVSNERCIVSHYERDARLLRGNA
jgi:hypothetical protein